jgi:hypothetical protein
LCIIGAGFDSPKIHEIVFNSFLFWFALLRINYHQASVKDIVIVGTIEIYLNQHDKQTKDGTMRSLFLFDNIAKAYGSEVLWRTCWGIH